MPRSKKNISFMSFINKKYKSILGKEINSTMFYNFDDYALYLFYDKYKMNTEKYYWRLEDDFREYVNMQMHVKPRKRKVNNGQH